MEMLAQYLPLVRRVAGRVAWRLPKHVDRGDLIGAGSEGLLDAARRFDPSKGVAFGAYAEVRIRGAMLDELRHGDHLSRTGRRRQRELDAMPPAARSELAELESPIRLVSLDEPEAVEVSDDRVDSERQASRGQELERMREAVRALSPRLQTLLSLYYVEDLTLREIGRVMEVTESRVCQLHRDALTALRLALRALSDDGAARAGSGGGSPCAQE